MDKMIRIILVFGWLLTTIVVSAQKINLSVFPPLCVTSDTNSTINFGLALVKSQNGKLEGTGISALTHEFYNGIDGIAISGVHTYSKGNTNGVNISGLMLQSLGSTDGFSFAGLTNFSVGQHRGVQGAALINFNLNRLSGLQFTSGYNVAGNGFEGVQTAGLINISSSHSRGLQLSSVANLSFDTLTGAQIALVNLAGKLHGFQLGIVNLASHNKGFQLGIINFAHENDGIGLGLVNISKNTRFQILAGAGNFATGTLAVRFTTRRHHTTLSLSSPIRPISTENTGGIGYKYGFQLLDIGFAKFIPEIGYTHLMHYKTDTDKFENGGAFQADLFTEIPIVQKFGIFLIMGITRWSPDWSSDSFSNKFLIEGGIVLL